MKESPRSASVRRARRARLAPPPLNAHRVTSATPIPRRDRMPSFGSEWLEHPLSLPPPLFSSVNKRILEPFFKKRILEPFGAERSFRLDFGTKLALPTASRASLAPGASVSDSRRLSSRFCCCRRPPRGRTGLDTPSARSPRPSRSRRLGSLESTRGLGAGGSLQYHFANRAWKCGCGCWHESDPYISIVYD